MTPTDTGLPDITFIDLTSYAGLATGLLTFNLLLGLLLSARYNPVASWPHRRLPLYDLHNWTGYIALTVVLLHPALLLPSVTAKFGWLDIVLPFWAPEQPTINVIGVFAAYALVFVVVTSSFRTRIGIRTWKAMHYTVYASTSSTAAKCSARPAHLWRAPPSSGGCCWGCAGRRGATPGRCSPRARPAAS